MDFRDFIESFRNFGGAQTIAAIINFQEELFYLEQSGMALLYRTNRFEPPNMVFCQYASREIKIYDYANREPKTTDVNYGLLTHISEIKNNIGIDIGIVPKNVCFIMKNHDYHYKVCAHALAIYGSSAFAFSLKTSRSRHDVPMLSGTPVLNVSVYIQ